MNDLTHQGNITRDVTNDGGRFVSLSCPTYLLLLVVVGTLLLLLVPATVTDLATAVHKATYGRNNNVGQHWEFCRFGQGGRRITKASGVTNHGT